MLVSSNCMTEKSKPTHHLLCSRLTGNVTDGASIKPCLVTWIELDYCFMCFSELKPCTESKNTDLKKCVQCIDCISEHDPDVQNVSGS